MPAWETGGGSGEGAQLALCFEATSKLTIHTRVPSCDEHPAGFALH